MTNITVNDFLSIRGTDLELFEMTFVNKDLTTHPLLVVCIIISILVVNIPIIFNISRETEATFLNTLMLLDCGNALMHIPVLLQFFRCFLFLFNFLPYFNPIQHGVLANLFSTGGGIFTPPRDFQFSGLKIRV